MTLRIAGGLLLLTGCFVDAVGLPPGQGGQGPAEGDGGSEPLAAQAPVGGSETGGEGGAPPTCGDGAVDVGEGCDPAAVVTAGCVSCQITAGFSCDGAPSVCAAIEPIVIGEPFDLPITDLFDHYDGTIASMDCHDLTMPDAGFTAIQWVTLQVAVDHGYAGDLVIKLVPPAGTPVATVLSRAAVMEAADDYFDMAAEGSDLSSDYPITFDDTAAVDAELLGSTIEGGIICFNDNVCTVKSNPGAAGGLGLADLVGLNPVGIWRVCFADADDDTAGTAKGARVTVLAW